MGRSKRGEREDGREDGHLFVGEKSIHGLPPLSIHSNLPSLPSSLPSPPPPCPPCSIRAQFSKSSISSALRGTTADLLSGRMRWSPALGIMSTVYTRWGGREGGRDGPADDFSPKPFILPPSLPLHLQIEIEPLDSPFPSSLPPSLSTYLTANYTTAMCHELDIDYKIPTAIATSLVNITYVEEG